MLAEGPVALASLAGNTVVASAVTDVWEEVRIGFARLLGRQDSDKTMLAAQRLAETHEQLTRANGADLERVQAALAAQWVTRLRDLLEEYPGTEAGLRALVQQIRAQLPAERVSAADHAVAAGRDVNISAAGGGVAAGVISGEVSAGNPTIPGTGQEPPRPGPR